MSEEATLQELLETERDVALPSGRRVKARALLLRDWQAALELYSRFLGVLVAMGCEATEEAVGENLPSVLMEVAASGAAADVERLLSMVSDARLEDLRTVADAEALWAEVARLNRRPFGLRFRQLQKSGALLALAEVDLETLISVVSSTAPELTPEMTDSPLSTPSPSPAPTPSTSDALATSEG